MSTEGVHVLLLKPLTSSNRHLHNKFARLAWEIWPLNGRVMGCVFSNFQRAYHIQFKIYFLGNGCSRMVAIYWLSNIIKLYRLLCSICMKFSMVHVVYATSRDSTRNKLEFLPRQSSCQQNQQSIYFDWVQPNIGGLIRLPNKQCLFWIDRPISDDSHHVSSCFIMFHHVYPWPSGYQLWQRWHLKILYCINEPFFCGIHLSMGIRNPLPYLII